ncbi:MAG: serine protease [Prevotellaceae bacterium]|nr:serine protease [Prevotellaceae bacterium]
MEIGRGFGSGFVYVAPSGEAYILTNKHVVRDAPAADILFFTENNDSLIYQNCPVAAVSPNLDIALVALPANAKTEGSLAFYTQPVKDGQDVWSAGYPSLGNKPAWQLGKGIISNQNVRDEHLADPAVTFIFQHTAQIDPGSSGGPLLIKNETGYEVIGINTWKARGRENAGFSIPAKAIVRFLNESAAGENENPVKEIPETLFKEPDVKLIAEHISFDWVMQITASSFDAMITRMSDDSKELITDAFQEGEPIKALRLLIADAAVTKIKKEKVVLEQPEIKTISDSEMQAVFYANGKEYSTQWIKEQNAWKISSFSLMPMEDITAKSGFATELDFNVNISLQADYLFSDKHGLFYSFAWEKRIYKHMMSHIGVGYGTFLVTEYEFDPSTSPDLIEEEKHSPFFNVDFGFGALFPLRFSSTYLVPYAMGIAGMELSEESSLFLGVQSGVNVGFKVSKRNVLYIGPEFNIKFLGKFSEFDLSNQRTAVGIKVGIYL